MPKYAKNHSVHLLFLISIEAQKPVTHLKYHWREKPVYGGLTGGQLSAGKEVRTYRHKPGTELPYIEPILPACTASCM